MHQSTTLYLSGIDQTFRVTLPFQFSIAATSVNRNDDSTHLGIEEMRCYNQLHNSKRKKEWLAGRFAAKSAMVAFCIAKNIGTSLKDLTILPNANGAPVCIEHPEITLSISHSHENAIAIAAKQPIGIDIEYIANLDPVILDWYFTENEKRIICRNEDGAEKIRLMASFWSAKEAVSKLYQIGAKLDFTQIDAITCAFTQTKSRRKDFQIQSIQCRDYAISIAHLVGKNHGSSEFNIRGSLCN
jgi:phosphopantetheine--protein transferase-like protein